MKSMIRITAVAAALSLASSAFAGSYNPDQDHGSMGAAEIYNRVITITPDTRWVNVDQGEDVKFVDATTGLSFVWDFDTTNFQFDLANVAPSGVLGGKHVMAYVAPRTESSD